MTLFKMLTAKHVGSLIIIIVAAISACTFHRTIEINPKLSQKPIFDPLPLTIGVYKSPAFTNRIAERLVGNKQDPIRPIFVFQIGKASSELFDQVLASMFLKIVPMNSEDFQSPQQELAGIIAIDFVDISWHPGRFVLTYLISIKDENGRLITSWPVTNGGKKYHKIFISEEIELAMLDTMSKFMVDFWDKPEIISWLRNHEINIDSL